VIDENGEHVGGAGGAASEPASRSGLSEGASSGSGQIEIPLGTPITEEELEHLRHLARDPNPRGATSATQLEPDDLGQSDPQE